MRIIFIALTALLLSNCGQTKTETNSNAATVPEAKPIGIGEVLKTDYFAVRVNKVSVKNSVTIDGYGISDLKADADNKYLIINVTFKNTDNESRMIVDGNVLINYNGKDYTFDKSEVVLAEGWGLFLDQINPLTSKTTNLVYKIPKELTGTAYYNPGRSGSDVIMLGNL